MEERFEKFVEHSAGTIKMFYHTCRINRPGKVSELTCYDLIKIHSVFPELNLDWLITGRGSMLYSELCTNAQ